MRDGLYRVRFNTPKSEGSGVVYAQGGKLWGGDAGIYYVGTYSEAGGKLTATVNTARHSMAGPSVFGVDRVTIQLRGVVQGDTAKCDGSASQAPGVSFSATLERISD